ncbi:MAG: DUF4173 domain-containing protein [Pirellulales bacterium]|nr:DUF4173 domain-containing protein [Pirellulales bacterium]
MDEKQDDVHSEETVAQSDENPAATSRSPFAKNPSHSADDEPIVASVVAEPPPTYSPSAGMYGRHRTTPPAPRKTEEPQPPVGWRELLAVIGLVVLCDLTIYRGHGWSGYAALFVAAPALLWLGTYRPRLGGALWLVGAMLVVLAAKMVWCVPWLGWLMIGAGFALVAAFALALSGHSPYVLAVVLFASQTLRAGYERLNYYGRRLAAQHAPAGVGRWLNVVLPLVTLLTFGMIFIVANPDVVGYVSKQAEIFFNNVRDWLAHFSAWEVVFWIAVLWIGVGLLRLAAGRASGAADDSEENGNGKNALAGEPVPSPLYAACRNTLATVILLFAVYLVFEFKTLWFHTFPQGFYYSGYAHQGAAWLTVALGLATVILSLVFSGRMPADPRVGQLRRLAWIWSLQNFVLAAAVYNRLGIYIGFNGMTRMRIVGLFGISAVVVGFILVLVKIAKGHSFAWLLRRHLWTLAAALYLLVITPVDVIVVGYNVRQILAGHLAPSVQITVHPISSEGITLLAPLLECKDAMIREGVRALLAQRDEEAETLARQQEELGWTAYQMSDRRALDWFREHRSDWDAFASADQRQRAYDKFVQYAYQWF